MLGTVPQLCYYSIVVEEEEEEVEEEEEEEEEEEGIIDALSCIVFYCIVLYWFVRSLFRSFLLFPLCIIFNRRRTVVTIVRRRCYILLSLFGEFFPAKLIHIYVLILNH